MEEDKITTVEKTQKTKDPKRVEAGKKLAIISKAAKEKKARERLIAEKTDETPDGSSNAYVYTSAVVVALGGLWYGYSKYNTKTEPTKQDADAVDEKPERTKRSTLDSFE